MIRFNKITWEYESDNGSVQSKKGYRVNDKDEGVKERLLLEFEIDDHLGPMRRISPSVDSKRGVAYLIKIFELFESIRVDVSDLGV